MLSLVEHEKCFIASRPGFHGKDSSHRVIMGKILFLIGTSFLQVTRTTIKSLMGSKFGLIQPQTSELNALECLEKLP